jgi:hypothetical protein
VVVAVGVVTVVVDIGVDIVVDIGVDIVVDIGVDVVVNMGVDVVDVAQDTSSIAATSKKLKPNQIYLVFNFVLHFDSSLTYFCIYNTLLR